MSKARLLLGGTLLAALLQTVALAGMLWPRYQLLEAGKEVVLQSAMVDPRDLFRGHYTRLNLTAGTPEFGKIGVTGELEYGQPVFVELKQGDGEYWIASHLYAEMPEAPQGPILQARLNGPVPGKEGETYRLGFPFDRFFAPEKRALELQDLSGKRKLGVIIAVGSGGQGLIKGITIDGDRVYSEKVF